MDYLTLEEKQIIYGNCRKTAYQNLITQLDDDIKAIDGELTRLKTLQEQEKIKENNNNLTTYQDQINQNERLHYETKNKRDEIRLRYNQEYPNA